RCAQASDDCDDLAVLAARAGAGGGRGGAERELRGALVPCQQQVGLVGGRCGALHAARCPLNFSDKSTT
ncbi:Hypothetical predicted protein, partial [Olea europaea subsp. europaea]